MKPLIRPAVRQRCAGKSGAAYTLIEVIVITGVVLILGSLGLVTLAKHKVQFCRPLSAILGLRWPQPWRWPDRFLP